VHVLSGDGDEYRYGYVYVGLTSLYMAVTMSDGLDVTSGREDQYITTIN